MFNKDHKLSWAYFGITLVLIAGMLAATPVSPVQAATLMVTTTSDSGPGSLRQAMMDATSGTIIRFDPLLAGQTITLSEPVNLTNKRLILDGSGLSPQVTINGGGTGGFNLNGPMVGVNIYDLTLSSFNVPLRFRTDMTIRNSTLKDFTTDVLLANAPATLTIANSTLENNNGVAITTNGGTIVSITDSVIRNNIQALRASAAEVTITHSTVSNHQDEAIIFSGSLTITDSNLMDSYRSMIIANGDLSLIGTTIYQTTTEETLIINGGTQITIANSTIVTEGSGRYESIRINGGSDVNIFNSTIVAMNNQLLFLNGGSPFNVYNSILFCAHENECIFSNNGTINDVNSLVGVNGTLAQYGLSGLADNGGPTLTMALLLGSSLIDAGDDVVCAATPVNNLDQRGVARPSGSHCDIGSYEYSPPVRYVKWDATGANDGTSWTDAFTDLQSALAAASGGDEIWVAAGTYKPTAGTDRTVSFALKNGVAIYGGFAGTETARTQRDPGLNITILSGDIGVTENASDNSYHVVVSSNTDSSTVLDGFTITNGNADTLTVNGEGGGMYNYKSSPTLANVIFSENAAILGGGMYNGGEAGSPPNVPGVGSHPTLTNVTFKNNSARQGGGMENADASHPSLTNVTFENNTALRSGGGMLNMDHSDAILTNVTFSHNTAGNGGGMANSLSDPSLTDVTFIENSAEWGGGIGNGYSNMTITNATFTGNSASTYGGAVSNEYSSPSLTNVTVNGNSAVTYAGGIYNDVNSRPTLRNATLSGNTAATYGGLYNLSSGANIHNSILYGNSGDEIYATANVTYSIVEGGYTGTGNLNADPLLGMLQDNGGFTQTMALGAGSPAIDAANSANCPATDQRGVTRPLGGGCDIGAYEAEADTTLPTVTSIVRADPNPSNADVVNFTVTFSEDVTDVDRNDFKLNIGGEMAMTGIMGVTGSGSSYTVIVVTGSGNGTLDLSVPVTATIQDLAGNQLGGLPFSGSEQYTIDKTGPTVSSIVRAEVSPTNASSVNFTVTFSEPVMDVTANDFTLDTTGSIAGASIVNVAGSNSTWTVAVNTGSGDGTLEVNMPAGVDIKDMAGNSLGGLPFTDGEQYTIDKTLPVPYGIDRVGAAWTNAASVDFRMIFSEPVTGVDTGDFHPDIAEGNITGAAITNVAADAGCTTYCGVYVVTVSTGSGDGWLGLSPVGTGITDAAGNSLGDPQVYYTSYYVIDKTSPIASSIVRAGGDPTSATSVYFTVTFSEPVVGVDATAPFDDFALVTTGVTGAAITDVSGSDTTWTVTVDTGSGSGTIQLNVPVGASIADVSGNSLAGLPFQDGEFYTIKKLPGVGKYDDADEAWEYTGTVTRKTGVSGPYLGTWTYLSGVGDTAEFEFNGSQITLWYSRYTNMGKLAVYLDDGTTPVVTLNQYKSSRSWQSAWVSENLGAGTHKVKLVHTGPSGKSVNIDAIQVSDVLNEGMYDDTDPNLVYMGSFSTVSAIGPYQDTYSQTKKVGDTAAFWFSGSQLTLFYTKYSNMGNLEVSIDNVKVATLNQKGSSRAWNVTWTSGDLGPGVHKVVLKHAGPSGKYVNIDALRIGNVPGEGMYDDDDYHLNYTGDFKDKSAVGVGLYEDGYNQTNVVGSSVDFTFTGSQVLFWYSMYSDQGNVEVQIDGVKMATINQKSSSRVWQVSWASGDLGPGVHKIQLKHLGPTGKFMSIDALQVRTYTP